MKLLRKILLGTAIAAGMFSGGQVLAMDSPYPYCKLLSLDPSAHLAAPPVVPPEGAADAAPHVPTIFELLKQTTDAKDIVNRILNQSAPKKPEEFEAIYNDIYLQIRDNYIEPQRLVQWAKDYQSKYKGKLTTWAELNAAIADMTHAVGDRWTNYTDPSDILAAAIGSQDKTVYFGASLRLGDDGTFSVEHISPGSTAQSVGVREGDRIISVNGATLKGMSKTDADKLLSGTDGAPLRVVSIQDGKTVEDTYTLRAPADDANEAKAELIANNIAYIKLPSFMDVKAFNKLIGILVGMNMKTPGGLQGFVLDLRYNGGGLVPMAKFLVKTLTDRGVVINERKREDGFIVDEKTSIAPATDWEANQFGPDVAPTMDALKHLPMVILINGSSASASEIVTGALQEIRPNTTVVGERSFGKGVEMIMMPTATCGQITITSAAYTTPSGKWLHNVGITPDITVHQPRGQKDDAQLAVGVNLLIEKTRTNGANVARLPALDKSILGTPAPRPLEVVKLETWQERVMQYRSEILRGLAVLLLVTILGGYTWLTRRRKH